MEYNKKEQLFDKINGLMITSTNASDTIYNRGVVNAFTRTNEFFDDELVPEVPQYIADWYESNKKNLDYNLWNYIMDWEDTEEDNFKRWVNNSKDAFQTIINMHQFGYTVEKEQKYTVKIKSVNQYLVRNTDEDFLGFLQSRLKSKFTRKELEDAGLGEVFNSPLFEVEEVEE